MIQSYWLGGWKIRGTDMPADAAGPADRAAGPADRATGAELVAPPVAGPPLAGGRDWKPLYSRHIAGKF